LVKSPFMVGKLPIFRYLKYGVAFKIGVSQRSGCVQLGSTSMEEHSQHVNVKPAGLSWGLHHLAKQRSPICKSWVARRATKDVVGAWRSSSQGSHLPYLGPFNWKFRVESLLLVPQFLDHTLGKREACREEILYTVASKYRLRLQQIDQTSAVAKTCNIKIQYRNLKV
jgi:hypothetical protein